MLDTAIEFLLKHLDIIGIGMIALAAIVMLIPKRQAKMDQASSLEIYLKDTFNRNNFVTGKRTHGQSKLENMLEIVLDNRIDERTFLIISLILMVVGFFVSFLFKGFGTSLFTGILLSVTPYLALTYKYGRLQAKGSYEGETFLNLLLVKYRTSNRNIELALEEVAREGQDIPTIQPYIVKMLNRMRMTRDRDAIQAACDDFASSIGTRWAKMLANNIFAASYENMTITAAIEDVLIQLRRAKQIAEERNRANAETGRLFVFIPICYVGTYLYAFLVGKLSLHDVIERQFVSTPGYLFFIISLWMTIVCYFLLAASKNRKLDY